MMPSNPSRPGFGFGIDLGINPPTPSRLLDQFWDDNAGVYHDDDEYVVTVDLPGFDKDAIDLTYDDGQLHINATRTTDQPTDWSEPHSHTKSYRRTITLPDDNVIVDEITASYNNGVLEVRLPVETDEEDAGTSIEIE